VKSLGQVTHIQVIVINRLVCVCVCVCVYIQRIQNILRPVGEKFVHPRLCVAGRRTVASSLETWWLISIAPIFSTANCPLATYSSQFLEIQCSKINVLLQINYSHAINLHSCFQIPDAAESFVGIILTVQ
jgi:hypothetical protein